MTRNSLNDPLGVRVSRMHAREMDLEEFVKNIMSCHREALNNPNHACHAFVKKYQCEPFRFRDKTLSSRINDVKVMLLGLSPGNPEEDHKPYTPQRNAQLEEVMEYLQKPILNGIDTNFRNAMRERIGNRPEYVKANVVHAILDKEKAQACLEACGNKFLLPMIRLFCGLRYLIVYDFDDKKVLNLVNKKLNISPPLGFGNSTAEKGILWNGVTVIAARRKRRYIRRLSSARASLICSSKYALKEDGLCRNF